MQHFFLFSSVSFSTEEGTGRGFHPVPQGAYKGSLLCFLGPHRAQAAEQVRGLGLVREVVDDARAAREAREVLHLQPRGYACCALTTVTATVAPFYQCTNAILSF